MQPFLLVHACSARADKATTILHHALRLPPCFPSLRACAGYKAGRPHDLVREFASTHILTCVRERNGLSLDRASTRPWKTSAGALKPHHCCLRRCPREALCRSSARSSTPARTRSVCVPEVLGGRGGAHPVHHVGWDGWARRRVATCLTCCLAHGRLCRVGRRVGME